MAKLISFMVLFMSLLALVVADDGLLLNGDFETPPQNGFSTENARTELTEIPNWSSKGTVELIESSQTQGAMILVILGGTHAVRLGNDAEISQDLKLEKGSIYSVTFSSARTCAQLESLNVSVSGASQTIDLQTVYNVYGWELGFIRFPHAFHGTPWFKLMRISQVMS
ncbi:unnamed protein product [Rhodiola kirilowii]